MINSIPKLIVLDKNKHNTDSVSGLRGVKNSFLLFKPFSGGKFHHKLIMQFLKGQFPIVYTGSFHISTNAVQRNSENIIGIKSKELADDYLASILLNSGLGEQPNVWKFIFGYPRLRKVKIEETFMESRVLQAARKILSKCQNNMDRYLDRLERVRVHLQTAATDGEQQDEINRYFEHCTRQFNSADADNKLRAIEELKETVFNNDNIIGIYLTGLKENCEAIKAKFEDIDELPHFEKNQIEDWLEKMSSWVENAKRAQEMEDKDKDKVNFKDELDSVEKIYIALQDLYDYEATFTRWHNLVGVLTTGLKG